MTIEEATRLFLTQLRNERYFNEGLYDWLFDHLAVKLRHYHETEVLPFAEFRSCIYLVDALAEGNRFLPEAVSQRVEEARDELYGLFVEQD